MLLVIQHFPYVGVKTQFIGWRTGLLLCLLTIPNNVIIGFTCIAGIGCCECVGFSLEFNETFYEVIVLCTAKCLEGSIVAILDTGEEECLLLTFS